MKWAEPEFRYFLPLPVTAEVRTLELNKFVLTHFLVFVGLVSLNGCVRVCVCARECLPHQSIAFFVCTDKKPKA